jgi:hypothetical protein
MTMTPLFLLNDDAIEESNLQGGMEEILQAAQNTGYMLEVVSAKTTCSIQLKMAGN